MLMRKSLTPFLFFFVFFQCFIINAQSISVKGKVATPDRAAASFAAVSLLSLPDSLLIKGTTTDIDGFFKIEGLQEGSIIIKVQSLGFKDYYSAVIVKC
jgi:hypothetical protein